ITQHNKPQHRSMSEGRAPTQTTQNVARPRTLMAPPQIRSSHATTAHPSPPSAQAPAVLRPVVLAPSAAALAVGAAPAGAGRRSPAGPQQTPPRAGRTAAIPGARAGRLRTGPFRSDPVVENPAGG